MRRSTARDFRIQLEELTRAVRRVEEERDDAEQSQEMRKVPPDSHARAWPLAGTDRTRHVGR